MNNEGEHQGITLVELVEYLGTWLGHVTLDHPFAKPVRASRDKMALIATLPLTLAHKVEVLRVWAFPTLFYASTLFYPTDVVRRQLDACMRWALEINSWGLRVAQLMQSGDSGGVSLVCASDYALWAHSRLSVEYLRKPGAVHTALWEDMKRAMTRQRKILDTRYQQLLICWHRKPKQGTPTLMTSAAAYSHFGKAMQGLWIPRNCVWRIPLWCSKAFLTAQGRPYFCRALSKACVLTLGDIISSSGDIHAHLLAKVARSFKDLYERRLTLMASAIKNGIAVQIPGRTLSEPEYWPMRELSAGCAALAEPEGCHALGVWEVFAKLRLPTGLQDLVRKAMWRRLEVSVRMLLCRQAPTAVCALCGAREVPPDALKSCPFLEGGIALTTVSWSLRFNKHAWVDPSRICWDLPQLSLSMHVRLFMCALLFARWKHRCDVVFGRARPDPSTVLARLHGILGAWAAEHDPSIPRSDILELRRPVSLRLQFEQLCCRTAVGDMPLEAGVPAVRARFQDRGSLVTTRDPTRLRAFVLSQPKGYAVLWGGGGGSPSRRMPHRRRCLQSINCSVRLRGC